MLVFSRANSSCAFLLIKWGRAVKCNFVDMMHKKGNKKIRVCGRDFLLLNLEMRYDVHNLWSYFSRPFFWTADGSEEYNNCMHLSKPSLHNLFIKEGCCCPFSSTLFFSSSKVIYLYNFQKFIWHVQGLLGHFSIFYLFLFFTFQTIQISRTTVVKPFYVLTQ